jgi:plastocyanin
LAAADVGGHLALCLAAKRVTVAAGAQATVALTVAPRRRFLAGRARPHPFTVEVRPETGPPVIAAATRFQEPVRWQRGALAAALAVGVGSAGALAMLSGRGSDGSLRAAVVPAPVTSLAPASACPTRNVGSLGLGIAGFAYCPDTLTVAAGAEIGWTNADLAPHTVTYDGPDGPVDSGSMAQGQSWSARFSQTGAYRYYCRFHPGMSGTIVVVSSQ